MGKGKKPYNYNGNRKYNKNVKNNKNNNNRNKRPVNLENTTRIRVDDTRLNDAETLDTSFLEGRMELKVKKNGKLKEKILSSDNSLIVRLKLLKNMFFGLALLCILILIVLVGFNSLSNSSKKNKVKETPISSTDKANDKEEVSNKIVDDNYLFVGDFSIDKLNKDDFDLDYHYVKSSEENLTTSDLINDLKKKIYDYNPSDVFLSIGMTDLKNNKSIDEIIDNYSKIIDSIKDNRPNANIYIESLYPIDKDNKDYKKSLLSDDIDNDKIKDLNKRLKSLSKEKKVKYIDCYSLLEKDGKLNSTYTDNGVYLNKKGYNVLIKNINSILG